jgi:hypothetical protein
MFRSRRTFDWKNRRTFEEDRQQTRRGQSAYRTAQPGACTSRAVFRISQLFHCSLWLLHLSNKSATKSPASEGKMGNASCCHYCAKEDEERTLLTHVRGPSEKDHAHVYNLHSEVKRGFPLTENEPRRGSSLLEVPGNRCFCDDDVGGGGTECMLLLFSLTAYTPYPHGRVSMCVMCVYPPTTKQLLFIDGICDLSWTLTHDAFINRGHRQRNRRKHQKCTERGDR